MCSVPGTVPTEVKPSSLLERGPRWRPQVSPAPLMPLPAEFSLPFCRWRDGGSKWVGELPSSHIKVLMAPWASQQRLRVTRAASAGDLRVFCLLVCHFLFLLLL